MSWAPGLFKTGSASTITAHLEISRAEQEAYNALSNRQNPESFQKFNTSLDVLKKHFSGPSATEAVKVFVEVMTKLNPKYCNFLKEDATNIRILQTIKISADSFLHAQKNLVPPEHHLEK